MLRPRTSLPTETLDPVSVTDFITSLDLIKTAKAAEKVAMETQWKRLKSTLEHSLDTVVDGCLAYLKSIKTSFYCPVDFDVELTSCAVTLSHIPWMKSVVVDDHLTYPKFLPPRELTALAFVWMVHAAFPQSKVVEHIVQKMRHTILHDCKGDANISYGCRLVRLHAILCKEDAWLLCRDIILEHKEGENVYAFIENMAKIRPGSFTGDEQRIHVLQAIVSGMVDYLQAEKTANYQRPQLLTKMYTTFSVCCKWPAVDQSPFLDKVAAQLQLDKRPETTELLRLVHVYFDPPQVEESSSSDSSSDCSF
jgi:hypothetical protein